MGSSPEDPGSLPMHTPMGRKDTSTPPNTPDASFIRRKPTTPPNTPDASWDFSLQELSASLSKICQSPCSPTNFIDGNLQSHKNIQFDHEAVKCKIIHAGGFTMPHQHASSDSDDDASNQSAINRAISSFLFTSKSGYKCRKVRVKHQESQRRLHDQLAVISGAKCRKKHCLNNNDKGGRLGGRVLARPSLIKESLVDTWQYSVDISGHHVNDIVIVVKENIINVKNVNGETISIINLNDKSPVKDKLVFLIHDENLIIKQLTLQGISYGTKTQDGEVFFFPVFHQDDDLSLWQAVFHIPGAFDKQNLHLRTYDEKLIIGWNPSVSSLGDVTEIIVDIPHNVKARTVNAVVSEHDQLVIEGVIGHGRERSFTM